MKVIVDIPWANESTMPKAKKQIAFECSYRYRDADGNQAFEHVRWRTDDERGKTFSYRYLHFSGVGWEKGKPEGADNLLWRVPGILANPTAEWWWTEGEKDAKALYEEGIEATSHHAGAGHTTAAQAHWLARARRVVLVADNDVNGAYCALRRYRLLRQVGVSTERLRVVQAREGKDAADHLAAGLGVEDFVNVPMRRLVHRASQYSQNTANSGGYIYIRRGSRGQE